MASSFFVMPAGRWVGAKEQRSPRRLAGDEGRYALVRSQNHQAEGWPETIPAIISAQRPFSDQQLNSGRT